MFASTGTCGLTVVVPTRNERDNVVPLLERLERVRPDLHMEVLFVDDSTDDTPCVISDQAARSSCEVLLIHRREDERTGGLGGAVQTGLIAARSDLICVMDADLQHPPELIGELLDEAARSNADLVVASRYCSRGDVGELCAFRLLLSRASATAAKLLFPGRLRRISDPMSGFFLIRRSAINVKALRPNGFKILLEILLAGRRLSTREVPFRFAERHAGASKASLEEGVRYIRRLLKMRVGDRMLGFGAVASQSGVDDTEHPWPSRSPCLLAAQYLGVPVRVTTRRRCWLSGLRDAKQVARGAR